MRRDTAGLIGGGNSLMDEAICKILPYTGNMPKIQVNNSKNVQITTANGTIQEMSSGTPNEKDLPHKSGFFDFINISAIAATLSGFGTFVHSFFQRFSIFSLQITINTLVASFLQ